MKEDVLILAIESSCDETAAAVVKNGREVLSNVISSQIALHTLYGGVVPEIASRKHIEKINQVVQAALDEANVTLDDITAIGVTYGPGLVGALLVGVAEAKAIAYAAKKPLVGVHHIEGHIAANFIEHKDLEPPFSHWSFQEDTHILCESKIMANLTLSDAQETMRQEKHLIKSHARSDLGIRADQRLINLQKKEIRWRFHFQKQKLQMHHMISVSAV